MHTNKAQQEHTKSTSTARTRMGETTEVSLPLRMVMSAFAGMGAATACHPLDVLRIQMQIKSQDVQYRNTWDCGVQVYKKGGVKALYAGVTAAYLRQWLYGSCRMGIYSYLFNGFKRDNPGKVPSFNLKLGYGALSGSIGAFVGTPSELALVRMGADSKLPKEQQRNYKNVFDCILRVTKEEGVVTLWKGATVTVIRAAVMGSALMGLTSQAKEAIAQRKWLREEGIPIMFWSATAASVVANLFTMPFDVVKSRLQQMPSSTAKQPSGSTAKQPSSLAGQLSSLAKEEPLYRGMIDCATKSVRGEGVLVLWSGFTPAFIKLAPYTVISLILLEKITLAVTGTNAL